MKLGDAIKSVTSALGIPQCEPCKERQRKLNELSDYLNNLFGGENGPVATVGTAPSDGDDGDGGPAKAIAGEIPQG